MNRKDLTILGILIGLAIGFTIGALCSWNGPAPTQIIIIMSILSLVLVILLLRNKLIFSNDCKHEWTFWEEYGYTFQRRRCKKCGKYQDKST